MPPPRLIRGVGLLVDKGADLARAGRVLAYHAVNYIARGRGRFRDEVTPEREVGPGSLFILRPGLRHWFWPHGTWDESYVTFDLEAVRPAFGDIVPDGPGHVAATPDPALAELFEALEERWLRGAGETDVRARHALHGILMRYHDAWRPERLAADGLINRARGFLRARTTAERVDLRRFAATQRLTPEALRRRFSAAVGMPPLRYWQLLKMRRAEQLLRDTALKVHEVAAAVGISDPYYFSRQFAKHAGVSPRAFRQRGG